MRGKLRAMSRATPGPILLAALIATICAAAGHGDSGERDVRYADDRLSVRLVDVPVAAVLEEIGRQSGADIRGPVSARRVEASFTDLSLPLALSRLLRGQSFALVYSGNGRLLAIDLLVETEGAPPAETPTPAMRSPTAAATTPTVSGETQAAVFGRTLSVSGPAAAALGTEAPTAGQLLHAALGQAGAAERAAARQTLLAAFSADAELENAYLAVLQPIDDVTLARLLRDAGPDRGAEDFMAALATQARSEDLRRKAAVVLEQLRLLDATPPGAKDGDR